ncbi:hypothetical protein BN59_01880 [Legionella massiliensis]|uniref:Glycosyltransferase RgtA/B/C/D-like domain-containing protein n=1 Tax=Legionella massiliensis TaxID=1034943 RepID=A0A078KX93_9GAMM|nr:hypothetical protein [Legionella massiliensis]CDZ77596.1 hypothetical protein BN59_01880 [Legionella massiliensis]CEE13334.1 hypothetical protein BN1094_01880 [Legionella massiliensis]
MNNRVFFYWAMAIYALLAYAFYPVFHLKVSSEPEILSLYSYLTQGFLSGHLYLNVEPKPELLNLVNPYDPALNGPYRFHDASLYQGKYYLYFGLLPVLSIYLPFKILTGYYPTDGLVAFIFLSLAFIVSFHLLIKIRDRYFPDFSESYLILAGFLLAFAGSEPGLLSLPRTYEVACAATICFMIIAFYFLYKALHNQYRLRDVFLFSLCLSLTPAARPNFALVCLILIPAVLIHLVYYAPKVNWPKLFTALLVPPITVVFLMGLYNYLRFGSVLQTGHYWQLSCHDVIALHAELADLTKIPRNLWYSFYYYFLQPFTVSSRFPFLGLRLHNCYYVVDQDYSLEAVGGVLTTTPIILIILALPKLVSINFKTKIGRKPLVWFVLFLAIVPLINAGFLLLLPFAVQRYEADFLPYLVILAILSFWLLDDYAGKKRWFARLKLLFIILAIFSIVLGLSFGLIYWRFT